jgi:hypothetical protein
MARKRAARGLPPVSDDPELDPPALGVREPRRPRPPALDDGIALPEPNGDRPAGTELY